MKVLMINYEFPPIGGGTGNACYYMLKEFSRYSELEIDLVTYSPDNITRVEHFSENIKIYYVKCGRKQALHYWKSRELLSWLVFTTRFLKSHLRENKYDLVHCWSGWPAGMIGYYFRKKVPYIVALRGSDVPGHTPRTALLDALVLRRLSKRIWTHARAVTSVSRGLAALASKTSNCNFEIINNGIDTTEFYPADQAEVQRPLRLLYVGRINPHKGVDDLVNALSMLKADIDGPLSNAVSLAIVGDGSMKPDIERAVVAAGLQDVVSLLGIVPHDHLAEIYRKHDVFVFPCHSDAMANVILEAIASGLAIVSTRTGGAELVDGNGLLIHSKDPEGLKTKLFYLFENPAEVAQLKGRSAELAGRLGWDICCAHYHRLYDQYTGQHSTAESH